MLKVIDEILESISRPMLGVHANCKGVFSQSHMLSGENLCSRLCGLGKLNCSSVLLFSTSSL